MTKLLLFKQSSIIASGYFILLEKTVVYIINRKIHGCLEIPHLFFMLDMIFLTRSLYSLEISCSTREIKLVFPRTHILFSISISTHKFTSYISPCGAYVVPLISKWLNVGFLSFSSSRIKN